MSNRQSVPSRDPLPMLRFFEQERRPDGVDDLIKEVRELTKQVKFLLREPSSTILTGQAVLDEYKKLTGVGTHET